MEYGIFFEEDILTIQRIYDIAKTYAPEYDKAKTPYEDALRHMP